MSTKDYHIVQSTFGTYYARPAEQYDLDMDLATTAWTKRGATAKLRNYLKGGCRDKVVGFVRINNEDA